MSEKDFEMEESESMDPGPSDPDLVTADSVTEGSEYLELLSTHPDDAKQASDRRIEILLTEVIAAELARVRDELLISHLGDLKLWLYNTSWSATEPDYTGPELDKKVLEIASPLALSQLECVYVLDSGLSGKPYRLWKQACEDLCGPLFKQFISPQESPDVLKEFIAMRFDETLSSRLYLYQAAEQAVFFNALVIQVQPLG